MENFNARKIKLPQNAKRLTYAIDLRVDWHIACLQEKDAHKKKLYKLRGYPPRVETEGFDIDTLQVMALEKLAEIEQEAKKREIRASQKESFAYWVLENIQKYSVAWFYAITYLFRLEKDREIDKLWTRYWKRVANTIDLSPRGDKLTHNHFKDNLDVERARNYQIEELYEGNLRRVANRLQGRCPFHEDRTPSFFIFDDNHFHCFGCQEHGSAIDYLMKTKNLDFVSAVKELQR